MDNTVEMQYDKLATALVKVQTQLKPAKKTSENPFFKSSYADLHEVWESCRKALTDNGFSVVQAGSVHDGHQFLRTVLLHSSGQAISGEYLVKPSKDDPQGLGAAWTYARRYSLAAICGVVTEDDDGEGAVNHKEEAKPVTNTIPKAAPANPKKVQSVSFVPEFVSKKAGEKNGKVWMRFSVKSPSGDYYSTFDEKIGVLAEDCASSKKSIDLEYSDDGKFRTIVTAKATEEVPF